MRSFVVAVVAILFVMGSHVSDAFAPVLAPRVPAFAPASRAAVLGFESSSGTTTELGMKCRSSIGSMKRRSKTCQIVRRRGRVYLIDKKNPRNKVRQGGAKMGKRKKK